jgi:uncharacterized protein
MKTSIVFVFLGFAGLNLVATDSAPKSASAKAEGQVITGPRAAKVEDIVIRFTATDGTPLEGKLTVPADAKGPFPVVYHLPGAGAKNYDNPVAQYRDADGQIRIYRFYDFYSHELARRGLAFFRMSKRGCTVEPSGRPQVDRKVFSKTTPGILLDDYAKGLDALRERKEIDRNRMVLSGTSEGTRLAPELALRSSAGIVGIILTGYVEDDQHDVVVWQNTVGPWRNIQKLIPAAADGALTRAEYDAAVKEDASVATQLPFATFDPDADGLVTAAEVARVIRPRLDAILKAVDDGNDDLIWQLVVNLSAAYLREGWGGEPNHVTLLKLDIPVAIFHGEVDGTTRVEGVRETEAAFRAAGKTNLTVHLYPGHDHDLNWTMQTSANGGPKPYQDAFAFAAGLAHQVRPVSENRPQPSSR